MKLDIGQRRENLEPSERDLLTACPSASDDTRNNETLHEHKPTPAPTHRIRLPT